MKLVSLVFVLATLGSFANASCPNACSGHGTCGTNDECTCFRNWVANDCSERVCTYGMAATVLCPLDISDGTTWAVSMHCGEEEDVSTRVSLVLL